MQVVTSILVCLALVCHSCRGFSGITTRTRSSGTFGGMQSKLAVTAPSSSKETSTTTPSTQNEDYEYPWSFTGRVWFRPALVRVSEDPSSKPPSSVSILNLWGWTVGGVVALEYDDSPVGPYREYVTMGALVSKRGCVGQWGTKLYVSTDEAERICQEIWNVPAQVADIEFLEQPNADSHQLNVVQAPQSSSSSRSASPNTTNNDSDIDQFVTTKKNPLEMLQSALFGNISNQNDSASSTPKQQIVVEGWKNTRTLQEEEYATTTRSPRLPILWTPTIKALWAPFVPFPRRDDDNQALPLHRLRLSASAIRLHLCGQESSDDLGIPLPIGLSVDNVLIEIGPQFETL